MSAETNRIGAAPLIPYPLLRCLKPPGGSDDAAVERLADGFRDAKSGTIYPDRNGVPSLLGGIDTDDKENVTGRIKAFYEEHPFPSYEGLQSHGDLVRRGEENPFAKRLLAAIGHNKLVLECGCGTGQMSHFLSLNNNHVLGIDLSSASLRLALDHKIRNAVPRAAFVQMNIFDLAIKDGLFDVVLSSGVLHHTKDARGAFASIVKKAKPGGIVIVGLYNWFARVPTLLRSKLIGLLGANLDYVVRKRIRDRRKAEIWIKDQYYNPHETWHSIDEVMKWFRDNNIEYLNCEPAIWGAQGAGEAGMFEPTVPGSRGLRVVTQLSWLATIANEGALFVMTGRKQK
jgi:2-polyprenyl-3-methyl-5-hydroxy-6-metoxy-1,4-benzoquinol methylase